MMKTSYISVSSYESLNYYLSVLTQGLEIEYGHFVNVKENFIVDSGLGNVPVIPSRLESSLRSQMSVAKGFADLRIRSGDGERDFFAIGRTIAFGSVVDRLFEIFLEAIISVMIAYLPHLSELRIVPGRTTATLVAQFQDAFQSTQGLSVNFEKL